MSDDRRIAKPADVFSRENFLGWLQMQPSEKEYEWIDCDVCLFGQYFAAHGRRYSDLTEEEWELFVDAVGSIAIFHPRTFGAALKRARAYQG